MRVERCTRGVIIVPTTPFERRCLLVCYIHIGVFVAAAGLLLGVDKVALPQHVALGYVAEVQPTLAGKGGHLKEWVLDVRTDAGDGTFITYSPPRPAIADGQDVLVVWSRARLTRRFVVQRLEPMT